MSTTAISSQTSAIKTEFKLKLLDKIKGKDGFTKFASSGKMERGAGDTVRWNKILRPARISSYNLNETSVSITEKEFITNKQEATIGYMGDAFKLTKAIKLVSIVTDESYSDEVADQIIRSREYVGLMELSRYGLQHRVDFDTDYEKDVAVTTATSTTAWRSTDITEANNFWGESTVKVGYCCATNPEAANYDNSSLITAWAQSNEIATTLAFPQNNTTSTRMHVVRGTGLIASDVMSTAAVLRVAGIGEHMQWKRFSGGIYRGFIDPAQHNDLYKDSVFTTIMQAVSGLKELGRYRVFRIYGIEFMVIPDVFREDADGTENASTGAIHNAPIFGMDSYNITRWSEGEGEFGINVGFINKADSGNIFGYINWITWDTMSAVKVLRATNVCVLKTGATAQPVVS